MSDRELEALFLEAEELPPDDVVKKITPWRKAMRYVIFGLVLSMININYWYLSYITQSLGYMLLVIGFRALKNENGWFCASFFFSVMRAVYYAAILILSATIYQKSFIEAFYVPLSAVVISLSLLHLICFRQAMAAVKKKSSLSGAPGAVTLLIIWQAAVFVTGIVGFSVISGWIIIIAYAFIIICLYALSRDLEYVGYSIRPAAVKIPNLFVCIASALIVSIGIVCGYTFFRTLPMDWSAQEAITQNDLRETLLALGFPNDILEDISEEDIEKCKGATEVLVQSPNRENALLTAMGFTQNTEEDVILRTIGVKTSETSWRIFYSFHWKNDPGFYGSDTICIYSPDYVNDTWQKDGDFSGRVLYDKDGGTYASAYHSIMREEYKKTSVFFGTSLKDEVFAELTLPKTGANKRGYIACTITDMPEGYCAGLWFVYIHQVSWRQYPALTAKEYMTAPYSQSSDAFKNYTCGFFFSADI